MPTTDARGHTVPLGTDAAARQSLLDLSLSIPSIVAAASATEAAQYIQALADAGAPSPSTTRPAFVMRTDLGMLMAWDGSSWVRLGGGLLARTVTKTRSSLTITTTMTTTEYEMARVTIDLPARTTVLVFASIQARPNGNASGEIRLRAESLTGTMLDSTNWHSHATTNDQWPTLSVPVQLDAGSHILILSTLTGTGSSSTDVYYPKIDVAYA